MADVAKVRRNIQRMIDQGAPEADIDAYIASEGVSLDDVKSGGVSTAFDVGMSALASIPKGVSGALGAGVDVGNMLGRGVTYGLDRLMGYTPDEIAQRRAKAEAVMDTGITPSSKNIRLGIETVTGPLYEPKTDLGRYADTTGQIMTGAGLMGAGGIVARAIQGAVPGISSEFVGQLPGIEGTAAEPYARGATALLTGGGAAALTRPKSVNNVLSEAMDGVTQQQMNDAMILMQQSRQGGGVPLTWPEAIQKVTGGTTTLDDVSRLVEQSPKGGPIMRRFYADRPQATTDAVTSRLNQIDPLPQGPEVIGPGVQRSAQGYLDDVNSAINQQTRPLYNQAHSVQIPPAQMQAITSNPAYGQIVQQLRNNKYLGQHYQSVADDSVEMIDAVQKVMKGDIKGLAQSTEGVDRFASTVAGGQRKSMMREAKAASPEYDTALRVQSDLRRNNLEPLQKGPTGALAETDDVTQQLNKLFPNNPLPNSEASVGTAIRAIAGKDRRLAENIIGAHVERVFNEAAQNLASGPNQAGGAKFAAVIAGNTQQAKNLEAAIRALPGGDSKWTGFKRLLDNLEATGTRKALNSPTAINQMIRDNLKGGSVAGQLATTALSPQRALGIVKDTYEMWRIGQNTQYLARLFTDPNAGRQLAKLAMMKPGSREAIDATARLLLITQSTGNSAPGPDR